MNFSPDFIDSLFTFIDRLTDKAVSEHPLSPKQDHATSLAIFKVTDLHVGWHYCGKVSVCCMSFMTLGQTKPDQTL